MPSKTYEALQEKMYETVFPQEEWKARSKELLEKLDPLHVYRNGKAKGAKRVGVFISDEGKVFFIPMMRTEHLEEVKASTLKQIEIANNTPLHVWSEKMFLVYFDMVALTLELHEEQQRRRLPVGDIDPSIPLRGLAAMDYREKQKSVEAMLEAFLIEILSGGFNTPPM